MKLPADQADPKFTITIDQLNSFCVRFNHSNARAIGIRFGQAWVNEFLPANLADPEVFYELDEKRAYALIVNKYVKAR
jgi:hypothetical protein